MYKIITYIFLITTITSTIAEDVETAHDGHFIDFLIDVLDQCETVLQETKDELVDEETSYFPEDVTDLNKKIFKKMIKDVKEFGKI